MSKKSLLKEGTVRRFMKLAGTGILASDFLTEQAPGEEDPLADLGGGEGGEDVEGDPEAGMEDFADVEMEEPGADEEEPEEEGDIEDAVRAMVDAIADVASDFGVDVEVGEEETAELEVPEFEGEEEEAAEEGEVELGGEEEPEELALQEGDGVEAVYGTQACKNKCDASHKSYDEHECKDCKEWARTSRGRATHKEALERIDYIDEDAVMHEVFHRVKNRLVQEKRTDDMASMLAEKIARRMNKRKRR